MQENHLSDCKVVIIAGPNCYRCKVQLFLIEGVINHEIYKVNNNKDFDVLKEYEVYTIEDIPTFILYYKNKEIFRTNEPKISPQWATHLVKLVKNKDDNKYEYEQ